MLIDKLFLYTSPVALSCMCWNVCNCRKCVRSLACVLFCFLGVKSCVCFCASRGPYRWHKTTVNPAQVYFAREWQRNLRHDANIRQITVSRWAFQLLIFLMWSSSSILKIWIGFVYIRLGGRGCQEGAKYTWNVPTTSLSKTTLPICSKYVLTCSCDAKRIGLANQSKHSWPESEPTRARQFNVR